MNVLKNRAALPAAAILTLAMLGLPGPARAQSADEVAPPTRLLMPMMNASRGRGLFVSKGCVTCHSVNGIGGQDAASLDAHDMEPFMGLFDLSARMWSMAPVMIPAQQAELGAQIRLNGDELADLIAFLHDDVEQANLTVDDLSEEQRAAVASMASMASMGGDSADTAGHMADGHPTRLLVPRLDASNGRALFVSKGCITCHSVNGLGGDFASALDPLADTQFVSLFDIPARMWTKATVMIPAQEDRLGEQIQLSGDELGDLVAFLNDDREQKKLTPALVAVKN